MKESERNERKKLFFYPFDTYKPRLSNKFGQSLFIVSTGKKIS